MSRINFLPPSFVNQARVRRRKARHLVLLALFAASLGGWGFVERAENQHPRRKAEQMEREVEAARARMTEVNKLRAEREQLLKQEKLKNELSQPISHTQVIAAFERHLPETISLVSLSIQTQRPTPRGAAKTRGKADAGPGPDQLDFEIDALAMDDLTVANLIGKLADDPLFDRVALKHSRSTQVQGIEAREVRLTMRVRLDRRFEQEVARAD